MVAAQRDTPDPANLDPANLDHDPQTLREMGAAVLDKVVGHLASLPQQPVRGVEGAEELCRLLEENEPPEEAATLDELLDPYFASWVETSFNTANPGYLAYVPGGGLFESALASFLAAATNRYTGVWQAAPPLVQLEANVLRWLCGWMGFPERARGLLTTGGSSATFTAVVCAREEKLGTQLRDGVLYTSNQAHLCVTKSARMAGILQDRVRVISVDDDFRMDLSALQAAIDADREAGLRPFMVVSSAGTVNTGSVDPLHDIADLCAREDLWHHCDGAYGACFHIVPELRPLLAGLERADSLTLDPHKGLFISYGVGALLVRDGEALRKAHADTASYLPEPTESFYDPSQYGPELSRDYRGLRLWLPIKLFGTRRFVAALTEKRALALAAAERLSALPGLTMDAWPELSLLAFHVSWPQASLADENRATAELMERVTTRGRVMLTGCTIDGRHLARVCVLSFRTRAAQIDALVEDCEAELSALLAERQLGTR